MTKEIRFNTASSVVKAEFGDSDAYTLHVSGMTVYFDSIEETGAGYLFTNGETQSAFVSKSDCDVSPTAAMKHAELHPGEKIRFADD